MTGEDEEEEYRNGVKTPLETSYLTKWLRPFDAAGGPDPNRCLVNRFDDCRKLGIDNVPLFVAAPMVRYSKISFRSLVRLYSADLVYTPMINAKGFIASEQCRTSEFTTCSGDSPTIVQFAAKDPVEFATAAQYVYRYCSGVDLNCGCPKRDVMRQGYGCSLLKRPDRIADIVAHIRRSLSFDPAFTVSVKIRLADDIRHTISLCRQVQSAGVSYICVHGRTPQQRAETPNYEAIALIKSSLHIPLIANGGIYGYDQALEVVKQTAVDGVMVANGLLENPALFAGFKTTPLQCVADWLRITADHSSSFDLFHQQLIFMLRHTLTASQRTLFNEITNRAAIVDFLDRFVFVC